MPQQLTCAIAKQRSSVPIWYARSKLGAEHALPQSRNRLPGFSLTFAPRKRASLRIVHRTPGPALGIARRAGRRAALFQMREPATHRIVQDPRRGQCGLLVERRGDRARRSDPFLGEPRRGRGAGGAAARRARVDRDARDVVESKRRASRRLAAKSPFASPRSARAKRRRTK